MTNVADFTLAQSRQIDAASDEIIAQIRPLLAGKPPLVQGTVLLKLTATWLAGHRLSKRKLERLAKMQLHSVKLLAAVEFERIHGRPLE